MFKRCLIISMCIALLLSFAACNKDDIQQNNSETQQKENTTPTTNTISVFKTENVTRITFYAYYGSGKGSVVPDEYLDEIINWLDSFEIDADRRVPEVIPPGTNTIHVEIEYSDGTIVKQGMNTTEINGDAYYISGDASPECYDEIISKTSLE